MAGTTYNMDGNAIDIGLDAFRVLGVRMWLRIDSLGSGGFVSTVSQTIATGNHEFQVYVYADGRVLYGVSNQAGATRGLLPAGTVQEGQWYSMVLQYDDPANFWQSAVDSDTLVNDQNTFVTVPGPNVITTRKIGVGLTGVVNIEHLDDDLTNADVAAWRALGNPVIAGGLFSFDKLTSPITNKLTDSIN